MDLQSLAAILQAALSPNPDQRRAAELGLDQLQYAPQHLVRLLQIIVDDRYDMTVRQVASIHFKNFIARNWSPDEPGEQSKISESDKDILRDNILVFIVQLPPLLRIQLGECIKTIINSDYPEQWPGLLLSVKHHLNGQQVYGALFVLRILTRKYEFKSDEERTPVCQIVEETFPDLHNIFSKLVLIANPAVEIADLIKLILKIFWSSVYLEIPKQLLDRAVFDAWMSLFLNLLERPVPLEGQPLDPEMKKSWGWWKVKKWTIHILNRLFTRFGDIKLHSPENKEFAQSFQKSYAGKILESYLSLLNVIRTGGYLPDRVKNLILQFLSNSIAKPNIYQMLKPHLEIVLFEIVFPLMCFNDNDQRLWDEDPHEYVRKGYDIIEDLYSPRTASMDFVSELVRKHGKENLHIFIQFIVEVFKRYDEARPEDKPYQQKDGALLAIGALCDKLKQTEPYKSELEHMLVQHVFPEFTSSFGYLRAKAAWVAGQYAHINFSDQNNFRKALHSVVSGLRDPEVPVRVDSVFALRSFVEACKDLNEIRPMLPQLLDEFLKLMNEVENEDLVFTLETIVDKFGEEMAPYAFGLCQSLAATFWRCMNIAANDAEADDTSALASAGCLRAISTILESMRRLPHLFIQVEPILLPIVRRMLTTEGQDVFEEVLEIVSYMTFYAPDISIDMWSIWPLMMQALADWAIDFFPNILIPLDNYISRGTSHFLTCKDPDYQHSLWTIMSDKNIDDGDIEPAPKLIEVLFQNCKGNVNRWVEPYLRITIERLRRTRKPFLRCLLIQVIANCLYYDAALTLSILQKLKVAGEVFNLWFQMLQQVKRSGARVNFKREHDKKVCCLGFTSLLVLPETQVPSDALGRIFRATLDLLTSYKDQLAEAAQEEGEEDDDEMEGLQSDEEGDADGSEKNMGGDAVDKSEVDNDTKLQKLAAQSKVLRRADSEDEDSDDDFFEDEDMQSPIDSVDPFIFFVEAIKVIQATDPTRFQNLIQSLDPHYQTLANGLALHAELRKAALEKEKSEMAVASAVS